MHESVLLNETIEGLDLHKGDVLVDGTLGRAGHSLEAFRREPGVCIMGIDRDEDALTESQVKLVHAGAKFELFKGNFRDMDKFVSKADKIILDLGVSSPHLDSSRRGFSFKNDEPLLMTMEKKVGKDTFTARDIVNGWAEEDIANVIYAYGEERYARRIAKRIVEARQENPIETTRELVEIIESAVPGMYRHGKIHPATRTFQALRIAVNDELASLKQGLNVAFHLLNPGGRLAVISFHSLEDRITKTIMKEWTKQGAGEQLSKKPITPTDEEARTNPRSRSAKLRIFIKK
jgi:16S rRNA (cytosine1402-N4)-methyltransferase